MNKRGITHMQLAVAYSRVSSKEQEQGFSLESQGKTLDGYAASKNFNIVKRFAFSESAQKQGRKHFGEMIKYLRQHPEVRVVIVEKMDRLLRDLHDYVLVEDLAKELNIEFHCVKEGQVLRADSKSQDKLIQGLNAVLARNYIENMKEEILKGQIVKAEKGQFPGRAPYGYAHNRENRTIVPDPKRAPVIKLIFDLYSLGEHSVETLKKAIRDKTGERISKSQLHKILKSRFYLGFFNWRGREYQGTHPPLVGYFIFARVQDVVSGRSKAKPNKRFFPFRGLMHCAEDGCVITAELHKGKYVHYHCSFGRGKHKFPYMPEQEVADLLGTILEHAEISAEVAQAIADSTCANKAEKEAKRREEISTLNQRLALLKTRMGAAYEDKCGDKVLPVLEEIWQEKMIDWSAQVVELRKALELAAKPVPEEFGLSAERILDLAQRAHSIYETRSNTERAQLLKMVLLSCKTDGVSIWPTYRQPFNLIFGPAENEEWRNFPLGGHLTLGAAEAASACC